MLTNQDRRAILEQVKSSGSGDIIAALQGQSVLPQQEQVQEQQVQQESVSIPPSNPAPINNVSMETPPSVASNLVDSTSALPTQLAKTGGVKKSHGGWHDFEKSKIGKFVDAKGLKRDGEYLMNTVGDYFGYENTAKDARRMLLDGASSINPMPDFINAADHAQQGKYTDAALYATFAGLPFTAGPLVREAKKLITPLVKGTKKLKGKLVNTLKNKLLKTRTPIGNTDMELVTDSKLAKFFEHRQKPETSKLVAQVRNKFGDASKGGTNEFINLSYNKGKNSIDDFYSFDEMFFNTTRTAGQSIKAAEKVIPKYSFISNKGAGLGSNSTQAFDLTLNRLKNPKKYVDATNYSGEYLHLNKYANNNIKTGKPTNLALNKFNLFTGDEFDVLQETYFDKFRKLNNKNLLNTKGADQYRGLSKASNNLKGLATETYNLGIPNMKIQKLYKKGGFLNMITNPIRKNISENLDPLSYEDPVKRVFNAAIGKKDPTRLDSEMYGNGAESNYMWWSDPSRKNIADNDHMTERMDLLNMTMNQPQKYNSIQEANYKPTKSKNSDAKYYKSVITENAIRKEIPNGLDSGYTYLGGVLGKYKIHKGEDEKGKYYSYYDKWDLNPFDTYENKTINKVVDKVTRSVGVTPPEIYGRVYVDDLEQEQTVGEKQNQKHIEEYRQNIKKQEKEYLDNNGYKAPKGYFSTNPKWDEKKLGGFKHGGINSKATEPKEKPINYRQHMMNYLHTTGRDTNMVNNVMNAIGQHEALNVADQKQISQRDDGTLYDGPGRGVYQFEMSDKGAASTALNRNYRFNLFNTDKELKDFPEINEFAKEKNPDFSTISRADQDGLFIGDKIFGGPERRNMFDAVTRNRTTPPSQEEVFQYWLKNHKGKVSVIRDGKNTTVGIDKLSKKEINVERKKWNSSTKKIFK